MPRIDMTARRWVGPSAPAQTKMLARLKHAARATWALGDYAAWAIRPRRGYGAFPANDGLTMLLAAWPHTEFQKVKQGIESNYLVLPIYEFTGQIGGLGPPPPELEQLLGAVAGNPAAMDEFASVFAGTVSPAEFLDPGHIGRLVGSPA